LASIIDAPVIITSSATRLPDGRLRFGITVPGAAHASVWGTSILSLANWQSLGPVTVTDGTGMFTSTPPYSFYSFSVP
jgi:hypothetical protein